MRHTLAATFVIASTVCTASFAYPADQTATFSLKSSTSPAAATVLRTIVGVKSLTAVDDHTLTVRDTPEKLELATAVVKMLEATGDPADTTLSTGDGTVIAAVVLNRASSAEVMTALRDELRIARIATAGDKRVFLRDSDSQIEEALKVIARLEHDREGS